MAWICSDVSGACSSKLSRKWVRFRSGSPAGAMRSSTCTTCTVFQGTSSFARARSICQGVWPPLTAITKRPRAAAAARASAAMISAALLATALASVSISIFMVAPSIEDGEWRIDDCHSLSSILGLLAAHYRIRPASGWYNFLVHFIRPPGTRLVLVDRSAGFEHRVNDAPGLFHIVLAGK